MKPTIICLQLLVLVVVSASAFDFNVSFDFDLKPVPRTFSELDGIRFEYPENEEDVMLLVRGRILRFRDERRQRIDAEAAVMSKALDQPNYLEPMRVRLEKLLDRELEPGFEDRYKVVSEEFSQLGECWRKWAGDVKLVRFHSSAETKERKVKQLYVFDQFRYLDSGNEWALIPPFLDNAAGMDGFDLDPDNVEPLILDLPLLYRPGKSAGEAAAWISPFLDDVPKLLHGPMPKKIGVVALEWWQERLILGELGFLFTEDDSVLKPAVARLLFAANQLLSHGPDQYNQKLPKIFLFHVPDEEATPQLLDEFAKMEMRADYSEGPKWKRQLIRNLVGISMVRLIDGPPKLLQDFQEAGLETPEGGFDWASFEAAIDEVYDGEKLLEKQFLKERDQLIQSLEARLAKLEADKNPAAAAEEPAAELHPLQKARLTKKFGDYTFTCSPDLEGVVEEAGPEYAEVLKRGQAAIVEALDQQEHARIRFDDEDLEALRAYGIEADPEILRGFGGYGEMLANPNTFIKRLTSGRKLNVWAKADLREILKAGGHQPNFVYKEDEDTVSFVYHFKQDFGNFKELTPESLDEAISMMAPPIEWPIILPDEYDPAAAEADKLAIFRAEAEDTLKGYRDGDPAAMESLLGGGMRFLTPELAEFIAIHEAVELYLVHNIIASPERRWFCDGLANWVAIQEVERRRGEGKGRAAFEEAFPSDRYHDIFFGKLRLMDWPALEDVKSGKATPPTKGEDGACYYFSTVVLEAALEGQDSEFLNSWLAEIQKTSINRANIDAVIGAYNQLTDGDLRKIVTEMVGR